MFYQFAKLTFSVKIDTKISQIIDNKKALVQKYQKSTKVSKRNIFATKGIIIVKSCLHPQSQFLTSEKYREELLPKSRVISSEFARDCLRVCAL